MVSAGAGALRLSRALGLAVAAYGLSLGAHLVGGGSAPTAVGSVVLLLATWWVCILVTHRRLGRGALVGVLGLSQLLLHQALSLAGTVGGCVSVVHSHAGHLADGVTTTCSAGAGTMEAMPHDGLPGVAMTVAHAVAAVLLAVVLARGEAAVWFLAALVWPAGPTPVRLPATPRPVLVRAAFRRAPSPAVVPGEVGRRGPPWASAPAFT